MQFANDQVLGDNAPIFIYDRLGEPNKDMLEENLAYVEKGEMAVSFASGMGAISAVLGILTKSGDDIITHTTYYGCTISLLTNWYPKYNIKSIPVDLTKSENILPALSKKTKVIYFESPANPNMDIIDIAGIKKIIDEINKTRDEIDFISIVVDNTFATPFCQRPISLGIDFVVNSLTKGLCGFGTDMGGVVVGPEWSYDRLMLYRKDFGGVLATKSAWPILVYGLPSLAVRFRQQLESAQKVAEALERDKRIGVISYPGLDSFPQRSLAREQMQDYDGNFTPGTLLYFIPKGKTPVDRKRRADRLVNFIAKQSYTITLAVSLGQIRTLIEHPGSMTHSSIPPEEQLKRGIDPGGIRLSIGLEKAEDIIYDLRKAMDNSM